MGLAEEIVKLSAEDFSKIALGDIPPTEEMKYCEKHRHVEDKDAEWNTNPTRIYGICKRCHRVYERNLTMEESSDWQRKLTTPMNI